MDKTIQRGDMDDHGLLFKIIPKHNGPRPSKKILRSCWIKKVPAWDPIQGQSIIPTNLSEFKVRIVYREIRYNYMNFTQYNKQLRRVMKLPNPSSHSENN